MCSGRFLCSFLILVATLPAVASTRARRSPTSPKLYSKQHSKSSSKHASTGQRSIDDSRASEIQNALVHSGYLSGEAASGHWDSQTEAAMQKFQSDNGWQTKLVPDSRAIIKLGLGPSHDAVPAQGSGSGSAMSSDTATAASSSLP
jgi:hypothetical protein